ncbi:MAG: flagellar basal body-associated FliL family protein [Rhodocyclaceae bacterium]|nr:flagellar basal body-associated FliL family protein [Rhodocyclaceae bacterium]
MAEKKPEGGEAEQPPPKKNKMMIIIIAAVLVVVLGGGAAYFLTKKKGGHEGEGEEGDEPVAEEKAAQKKPKKAAKPDAPPVFVKLDPFTVKLSADGQEAYLQVTPELRVLDATIGDNIKLYTPEIRHKVLLVLAAKKAVDLATPQGVQALSNEMRVTINHILEPPDPRAKKIKKKGQPEESGDQADPEDPVQAVLFTSFIIQ